MSDHDLPPVADWFQRACSRTSYRKAILDWMTPDDDQRYTGAASVRQAIGDWLAVYADPASA